MPRTKLRNAALRDRVVEVALATLAEYGVMGFTTRRIAEGASTSIPAVYELFGDKSGLVREVFFEGFRELGNRLKRFVNTNDPGDDLVRVVMIFRRFALDQPHLFEVMFHRPFADFNPSPDEQDAGREVREFLVGHVRRCIDGRLFEGDATDIAHVVLALGQGLAAQESAGWLGTSKAARDRRWKLAFQSLLDGLRPRSEAGATLRSPGRPATK